MKFKKALDSDDINIIANAELEKMQFEVFFKALVNVYAIDNDGNRVGNPV